MECPDLISETKFSRYSSSTWKSLTPTMEIFIRKINLELYEREFDPMTSNVHPSRRGFVNEIAFQFFIESMASPSITEGAQDRAISKARALIVRIEDSRLSDVSPLKPEEMLDAREQLRRLRIFFEKQSNGATIELSPTFAGCGIIDTCNGDIYFGNMLFEVKAGDRSFRSIDLRQVLTYAALNYAQSKRRIDRVGLFNPRMGISFSTGINELCVEVSGHSASHTLSEIVRVISSGEISR
jgi:hypothetical protein